MGTVPQNMSLTTDNPGVTRLVSYICIWPSVMLLASNSVTDTAAISLLSTLVDKTMGEMDWDNTEMDRDNIDSWKKSSDEIDILQKKDLLGTDILNFLTTSEQSSENENMKNTESHPSLLAASVLICFLLFPSLIESKKYEATLDHHESYHFPTSAMS